MVEPEDHDPSQVATTRDDRNAFPRLTPDQVDRAGAFGVGEELPSGTLIFERGERGIDFFIVLRGRVEIFDRGVCGNDGNPAVIHAHRERGFLGDVDLFSGRKTLVNARVATDDGLPARLLRVRRSDFARLLSAEPDVAEIVVRAFILRRIGLIDNVQGGVKLIGRRESADTLRLERFLRRNGYPLRSLHIDAPDDADDVQDAARARDYLSELGYGEDDLPVVVCSPDTILGKPANCEVADCLGLTEEVDPETTYDLAVVGAGPSGLAAAVYAASEGLSTIVIEADAPGGQAGTSSRIENYLGFPTGVSGGELAGRAQFQAQKFGASLLVPRQTRKLEPCDGGSDGYKLHLDHGPPVRCRGVVLACGARWRTLDLPGAERFAGSGIHYAATAVEAALCRDSEVVVIGGGNSAGQAAIFLSGRSRKVHMLVRGKELASSMSDYLVRRIEASDRIELCCETELTALEGDGWLRRVTWRDGTGRETTRDVPHVFLMIGATPNTDWLEGTIRRDARGFVLTGSTAASCEEGDDCAPWAGDRLPHALESSLPGVFAVGDVRSGSVKRVASAVGEGSVCIADLHRVLADRQATLSPESDGPVLPTGR